MPLGEPRCLTSSTSFASVTIRARRIDPHDKITVEIERPAQNSAPPVP